MPVEKLQNIKEEVTLPDEWEWVADAEHSMSAMHKEGDKHIDISNTPSRLVYIDFRIGEEDTYSTQRVSARTPDEVQFEIDRASENEDEVFSFT